MAQTGVMGNYRFKAKVVWLFLAALSTIFIAFAIASYTWHRQRLNDQLTDLRQSSQASFRVAVRQETAVLAATLAAIMTNDRMRAGLLAGDRDALLQASAPLFAHLRQHHAITHFYFVRPDRTALLRVHQPDRADDRIDRITMLAAEHDQTLAHGLELGPLGTFTLRVVMPWRDGERLLGYVELGKEIDGIAKDMAETLHTSFATFIDKSRLDHDNWEDGMRMLGRSHRWDQYASVVLIDDGAGSIPEEALTLFANTLNLPGKPARFEELFTIADRHLGLTDLPLTDAANQPVGAILVSSDVTGQYHAMWEGLSLVAAVCLAIGTVLAWMFHLILGHVEREHGHISKKLKAVFELSPLGMALTTLDGRYLEANDTLLAMVGYSRSELFALPQDILIGHRSPGQEKAQSQSLLTTGRYGPFEREYRHRDGHAVAARLNGVVVAGVSGETCVWTIIEDITERQRHERELHHAVERLTEANTELERFSFVASHDLQEPLRSIVSFSQLLDRDFHGKLGESGDEYIAFIVAAARRMRFLISDLLDYARVAGKGLPFSSCDCGKACRLALGNLSDSIEETEAGIVVDDLPTVLADEVQVMLLFQNLVSNALKFRRRDVVPELHIAAEPQDGHWLFSVTDNGIGVEVTKQDVFEIFRRLHAGPEYPGTGVGLALCKRIIERHGGRIWYESRPGRTTFFFTLPTSAHPNAARLSALR